MPTQLYFPASSGGLTYPLTMTYHPVGFTSTGDGTLLSASGTSNVKTSFASIGTAPAAGKGLTLFIQASGSGVYVILDVEIGTTQRVTNFFCQPSSAQGWGEYFFPLPVGNGEAIKIRYQTNGAANTIRVAALVHGDQAGLEVYNELVPINTPVTSGATLPATPDVPLTETWTQLTSATSEEYKALMAVVGFNGTTPAATQPLWASLGTGAASSETEIYRWMGNVQTTNPIAAKMNTPIIRRVIASGTRIAGRIKANTPGSDNLRIGLYGFK